MTPARRVALGIAMLALGFALVAFLGGVVVKHVVVAPSVGWILGALAGIGGVALVVRGWQLVLAGIARRWLRVAVAIAATLLVAQFLLLPIGLALDATHRPKAVASGETPADRGLAFEDVRLTTEDGVSIAGWWVPGTRRTAVIVLAGAGSTRDDALAHAGLLADAGFPMLLLDLRGHGDSGGPRNEFGWGAERDVRAGVDWLLARDDVAQVGVFGLSMGGEVALTAAAEDPRIVGVVAEGASARTWADARAVPDPHPVGLANEWLLFAATDLLSPASPPPPLRAAIAAIEVPVLLITGDVDHERQLGPVYAAANPAHVTLWALPDTPHTAGIRTHPAAYRERVVGWFEALEA